MEVDTQRIDETVLALLYLGLHERNRAWKGFDWDAMGRLNERDSSPTRWARQNLSPSQSKGYRKPDDCLRPIQSLAPAGEQTKRVQNLQSAAPVPASLHDVLRALREDPVASENRCRACGVAFKQTAVVSGGPASEHSSRQRPLRAHAVPSLLPDRPAQTSAQQGQGSYRGRRRPYDWDRHHSTATAELYGCDVGAQRPPTLCVRSHQPCQRSRRGELAIQPPKWPLSLLRQPAAWNLLLRSRTRRPR